MRNHTNMCVYWSKEIESNESENYHNTKFEAFVEAGCSFSMIRAYYDHQHQPIRGTTIINIIILPVYISSDCTWHRRRNDLVSPSSS